MRNDQVIRVLKIIRELSRRDGADVYQLAETFGVNTRTIKRDLAVIDYAGLPLNCEVPFGGRRKKWFIEYSDSLDKVSDLIDSSHYAALTFLMRGADPLKNTTAFTALDDLSEKLENFFGKKAKDSLLKIQKVFYSYDKHFYKEEAPDFFFALVDAISKNIICEIRYKAVGRENEKDYKVLPLKLFMFKESLYMFAYNYARKRVVTFNLNRLFNVKLTTEEGKVPEDFDPQKYQASAFGIYSGDEEEHYELLFMPSAAARVEERVWHDSQQMTRNNDGTLNLTFRCAHSPELESWVASFLDEVEVIHPKFLIEKLHKASQKMQDYYALKAK